MNISVDSDRCEGHGLCAQVAPEIFDLDEEGSAVVLVTRVPPSLADVAAAAAGVCPERAIGIS
jgi:ferredoxin